MCLDERVLGRSRPPPSGEATPCGCRTRDVGQDLVATRATLFANSVIATSPIVSQRLNRGRIFWSCSRRTTGYPRQLEQQRLWSRHGLRDKLAHRRQIRSSIRQGSQGSLVATIAQSKLEPLSLDAASGARHRRRVRRSGYGDRGLLPRHSAPAQYAERLGARKLVEQTRAEPAAVDLDRCLTAAARGGEQVVDREDAAGCDLARPRLVVGLP